MADDVPFKDARFKWAPAVKHIAKPWTGDTALSAMWRGLANRANEVSRIFTRARTDDSHTALLASHLKAVPKVWTRLPRSQRAEAQTPITNWATAFSAATKNASVCWLASLANVAMLKATALESSITKLRTKHWRACMGI